MLVSHRYRFIFLKTKKTPSTSVELYFEPFCKAPGPAPNGDASPPNVSEFGIVGSRGNMQKSDQWWAHMPARKIRAQLGEAIWSDYFRFATIRNPYEKAVSAYFFQKKRRGEPVGDPATERVQFQTWLAASGPPLDHNKFMIGRKYCLSDVIRLESLLTDLERVCQRLDVPFEPDRLPKAKSNIRPSWASVGLMYTDEGRSEVAKRYALEIERFGYGFPEAKTGGMAP